MDKEEIEKAYLDLELNEWDWAGFDNPKQTLLTYNVIAWFKKKRLLIVKIVGNKCIRKVITYKGLDVSRYNIDKNYNDELKHKNGKIKIIDFEII